MTVGNGKKMLGMACSRLNWSIMPAILYHKPARKKTKNIKVCWIDCVAFKLLIHTTERNKRLPGRCKRNYLNVKQNAR